MGEIVYLAERRVKKLIRKQFEEVFEKERRNYPSGLKDKIEVIKNRK